MKAIISDIHGNLELLEAVLADIKQQEIQDIYCLGDIVGDGPNPRECIDRVMSCKVCLLGNHDQGALFDPEGFNAGAERAIFWTRQQLESGDSKQNERRWEFLGDLPRTHRHDKFLFVHGSARNPLNEYVFPEDIYNQRKMERIFALVDHYCFQGHTHVPGIFTENLNFFSPEELNFHFEFGPEKLLINVGSVGQPRNGDRRASYVVLDDGGQNAQRTAADSPRAGQDFGEGGTSVGSPGGNPGGSLGPIHLTFRRVEYDVEATRAKIYAIPELDNFLGDRLLDGR